MIAINFGLCRHNTVKDNPADNRIADLIYDNHIFQCSAYRDPTKEISFENFALSSALPE